MIINKIVFFGKASQKWVAYMEYQGMISPLYRFDTKEAAENFLASK